MNLDLLMDVETSLEEGMKGLLASEAISAYTRLNAPDDFHLVRPRVEVKIKLGAATGHIHQIEGVYHNDTWFFETAIRTVTSPRNQEQDNTAANQFNARVRGICQTFGQATWSDEVNFPYHLIVEPLKDTTTDRSLQSDDNEEWAILTYSGFAQVRTAAWTNT